MVILGISPIVHESAAALIVDGQIVAAAAEERFTRKKGAGGFPEESIAFVLSQAGMSIQDVDAVALPWLPTWTERRSDIGNYLRNLAPTLISDAPVVDRVFHFANYTKNVGRTVAKSMFGGGHRITAERLRLAGYTGPIRFVHHHAAHVAAAYLASGERKALGVSLDGYGSGGTGSFYLCEDGRMQHLHTIPYPHSLGTFYRRVTQALGFVADRHEGKIVGLAAFGQPEELLDEVIGDFDLSRPDHFRLKTPQNPMRARQRAAEHSRADMAAAYQRVLELVATRYIGDYCARHGLGTVVAAGGVFANVKMNQRISDLPNVNRLFVFPAMGDMGVGAGAALFHAASSGDTPRKLRDVFLGPAYDDAELLTALRRGGLSWTENDDPAPRIAELLADGKTVCRFAGRMEFGPRALGNRSILHAADHPSINARLNDRLGRTEFMPFAPVVMMEDAERLFRGVEKVRHSAEFMTVTLDCTDEMKQLAPAAVHVDGTARPQLVRQDRNPELYAILAHYKRLSGRPALINTSFNMHEEPIVCSPADAVRAFLASGLDSLAMGRFLHVSSGNPGQEAIQHASESIG
ncbi:MAG: carbamoyltransferase family protein [Sphingomicrobium sp.]